MFVKEDPGFLKYALPAVLQLEKFYVFKESTNQRNLILHLLCSSEFHICIV